METRTLLLNCAMAPHQILPWHEAVTLAYLHKVIVLEEYDAVVSSPSTTMFIPAVMMLKTSISGYKKGAIKFSRTNVCARDGFRCQYCGGAFTMEDLNFDHVVPRKQGGKTVWTNIVSSCYPCNTRKGGRTPEQAGMTLLRKPARPHSLPLHTVFIPANDIPAVWGPYLDLSRAQKHGNSLLLGAAVS